MSDRKEVIKAVEYLNWYFTQDDGTADKNAVKAWEVLLREQKPANVTTRRIPANGGSIVWTCGKCGADLAPNNAKAKYCSACGKAVKWEVEV